jgi:hypothetical protein
MDYTQNLHDKIEQLQEELAFCLSMYPEDACIIKKITKYHGFSSAPCDYQGKVGLIVKRTKCKNIVQINIGNDIYLAEIEDLYLDR